MSSISYDREKYSLLFDIIYVFLPSLVPETWPKAQTMLRQQLSILICNCFVARLTLYNVLNICVIPKNLMTFTLSHIDNTISAPQYFVFKRPHIGCFPTGQYAHAIPPRPTTLCGRPNWRNQCCKWGDGRRAQPLNMGLFQLFHRYPPHHAVIGL